MLSFDIRTLESKAAQVDDDLAADDAVWGNDEPRPQNGVHIEGRLSVAGGDRFYLSGHIAGSVTLDCRRCLAPVNVRVEDAIQAIFAPTGDEATEDDSDVFLFDAGARELDIRPAVREAWLLVAPAFAQCSAGCKGLCPQCGMDLNTGTCSCAPEIIDSRWDALRGTAQDTPGA